ncbi:MAG: hypothetical protein U1E67_21785 [Hyphomicrobiales bacterium]|jgi:hypothetical protein
MGTLDLILAILAVLGASALMAGNFLDAMRRTKKDDKPKVPPPDQ